MRRNRQGLAVLVPAVLGVAVLVCAWVRPAAVVTSLYGLVGRAAERIPAFVRETSAQETALIVSSPDRAAAEAAAAHIRRHVTLAPAVPPGALAFLRRERAGLVAPETAALLATPEGRAQIARRARRRLYASPLPPLLGFADDPFFLTDGYLATLSQGRDHVVTNDCTHILIRAIGETEHVDLSPEQRANVRLTRCGPAVHARKAEARCRREINILTCFSILVIALLSRCVFRSMRWIPLLGCSLLVAALAGTLALEMLFREIHLMALVFGTTLMGLVIDYSFHWLLTDPAQQSATRRNLVLSFLTTELGLLPLVLASIPVLRQASVFLSVGLAGALGYVLVAYPRRSDAAVAERPPSPRPPSPRPPFLVRARVSCALLVVVAALGLFRLHVKTSVASLYRAPAELMQAERLRAAFGTFADAAFPSCATRQAVAADVCKLYAEQGAAMARELSLSTLVPPPAPTFDFTPPRVLLDGILADWTRETLARLALALALMLGALFVFCRRAAWRRAAPSFVALAVTAGLLSLVGVTLNLFHILAGFLLAGMVIDYALFLHARESSALLSPLCALVTSVAGFGALAFVSMPVAGSFGQVLGLGLPVGFVAALAFAPPRATSVEQAASPLGLEFLWLLYRLLGLRALHAAARVVVTCAWAASPAIRRAVPRLATARLFAVSLADKLVVMAGGPRLPRVTPADTPDARDFVRDVRAGKGVFVLSSHVGTIEVLVAMGACAHTFHAWMDVDRTSIFTRFYLRHAHQPRVVIHPISTFGMGAVFEAGDCLDAGESIVMAGDRGAGAFHFAAAFADHPVYFVACLHSGSCRYEAVIHRLPSERTAMAAAFNALRAACIARAPDQSFTFAGLEEMR